MPNSHRGSGNRRGKNRGEIGRNPFECMSDHNRQDGRMAQRCSTVRGIGNLPLNINRTFRPKGRNCNNVILIANGK